MGVLEQSYNTAMEKPLRILEIFNEFFGESRVDMQGFPTLAEVESVLPDSANVTRIKEFITIKIANNRGFILVHFPHVRVTNEYGKFVDINHLYAKVIFDVEGKIQGRFLLNRSEYSTLHFNNNYMHSHICDIPVHNMQDFQMPCTGSGPINGTICSLARDFDEDLWRLFCLELDRFTQVESIAGTPYHRLESLVRGGGSSAYTICNNITLRNEPIYIRPNSTTVTVPQLAEFVKYIIDKEVLKFSYENNQYCLAMRPTNFYIKMSNAFIDWYNEQFNKGKVTSTMSDLLNNNIIEKVKFSNGHLVRPYGTNRNYQNYIGQKICTFKGQDVLLTISDSAVTMENNDVTLLNPEISNYILTKIFNVINFRYGNRKEQGDNSCKEIYFL